MPLIRKIRKRLVGRYLCNHYRNTVHRSLLFWNRSIQGTRQRRHITSFIRRMDPQLNVWLNRKHNHLLPMQTQLSKETELKTGIILMKRTQYNDALDTFLKITHHFPKYLFSTLIPIYKYLILHFTNNHLRIIISELYLSQNNYNDAINELEDAYEIDPHFTHIYLILAKDSMGYIPKDTYLGDNYFKMAICQKRLSNNKDIIIALIEEARLLIGEDYDEFSIWGFKDWDDVVKILYESK